MHKHLLALILMGLGSTWVYAASATGYHSDNRTSACSNAKNDASKWGYNVSSYCDCSQTEYGGWVCAVDYDEKTYSNSSNNSYSNRSNSNSSYNSTPRNYQYNSSPSGNYNQMTVPQRRPYVLGGMQ
ncbi:hypothetical protein [Acinetobacter sp. DSM 11652]|uniref:hypothetical protein n=1 Tax=Acinetobacter sp. DSM 11652 TaxID=346222 RepID=UPI0008CDC341|nr:hypothetical protein [Acinetobacter sp. DSM 11652]SEM00108.1 hypothetical protein SAMN05216500_10928 [Acinetobacter sp. DSM 11652]